MHYRSNPRHPRDPRTPRNPPDPQPAVNRAGKRSLFSKVSACAGLAVVMVMAVPLPAWGEIAQSDLVLVRADEIVAEDLYAIGNRIDVRGRVEGDLLVAALDEVSISGEVTGDVIALASRVLITGKVGGRVAVASGTLVVDGSIGTDLLIAGWRATVGPNGVVARDVLSWGWRLHHNGQVGNELRGSGRSMEISGTVRGPVDVSLSNLTIHATAVVEGNLAYRSSQLASVDEAARIEGSLVRRNPVTPNIRVRALRLLTVIVVAVIIAAIGLAAQWSWPLLSRRAAEALAGSFWRCLLSGWLVLGAPFLLVGLAVAAVALSPPAAGLPLLVVFIPLIVAGLGVAMAGSLLASVPVATAIGWRVIPRRSPYAAFVVGMLIAALAAVVPLLRLLILVVAVPAGMGGWLQGTRWAARTAAPVAGD